MKIALISHLFPTELHPFHGKFIKDQLTLLNSDKGITADLVVPTPYSLPYTRRNNKNTSTLLSDGVNTKRIQYLSFPQKRLPKIISHSLSNSIQHHFKNEEFDVVHVHWLYPDALCIPRLTEMGFKCVLTIHGSDWYKNANNLSLFPLFKEIFLKTDHVFFVGEQLQRDVLAEFSMPNSKSSVIYNSVNGEKYSIPSAKKKSGSLKSLSWDPQKKHFLCVANIRKEKGVDILIDAVKQLSNQLLNVQFHIVGSADSESLEIDPPDTLTVHPAVPPDELITYYHAADAYISPSRKEGFGLALIEAATTGLPLVATPTGIAPKFIDEDTGIVCGDINASSLTQSILMLNKRIHGFSKVAIRNKALAQFGEEAYRKRLLSRYELLTS